MVLAANIFIDSRGIFCLVSRLLLKRRETYVYNTEYFVEQYTLHVIMMRSNTGGGILRSVESIPSLLNQAKVILQPSHPFLTLYEDISASFSAMIFDLCFLAIITLNLSKSLRPFRILFFSSFFAQAVEFHFSRMPCSFHAFLIFLRVALLGNRSIFTSVKDRRFREMTCLCIPVIS